MSYEHKRRINKFISLALEEMAKEFPNWKDAEEWLELAQEQIKKAKEEGHGT